MENVYKIGIDVGGSHITASLLECVHDNVQVVSTERRNIDSSGSAYDIVSSLTKCISSLLKKGYRVDGIGIAFPGPFDYPKGVSAIRDLGGKFGKIFGLHVRSALHSLLGTTACFYFANDAHCFAIGSCHSLEIKTRRNIFLTLGTGFGSAFLENGQLVLQHPDISSPRALYSEPFGETIADDYFSTRWFLHEYASLTGETVVSVKQLVEEHPQEAAVLFKQFAANLSAFLLQGLHGFDCDTLVIGGNIARANHLFLPYLLNNLMAGGCNTRVVFVDDTEQMIMRGAAIIAEDEAYQKYFGGRQPLSGLSHKKQDAEPFRKTSQRLLPVSKSDPSGYDIFPAFEIRQGTIYKGFDSLSAWLTGHKKIVIDGYGGVIWEQFREQLNDVLLQQGIKAFWYDIDACLKQPDEIEKMIGLNLNGDDPVFGKKYGGQLVDFFDRGKLLQLLPDDTADICIVYGTGAALCGWDGALVYLDVPKNEIQYRMRAGSIMNLGASSADIPVQMYKRFYFVDWPVLNRHKQHLLSGVNVIVDEQRVHEITWMQGDDFRNALGEMLERPFRARPWFEAGVWGGDWMKKNISGLNNEEVNYAWSFELITPENGIVMEGKGNLLEMSFDYLLFYDNRKLLGKAAQRFGLEFPIRFDFLDTYNGGNLSIQCHPRTKYIRENFGENFTQDETYYILDCEPDAKVYLGFQDDIEPAGFKRALVDAEDNNRELPVEKYVQVLDSHKHDLFLIPCGTIHASGKNNLVLEISSTPYIYTFKIYDWLRLDLNGQTRPINIGHAFNNLYFDRKGSYVQEQLVSKQLMEEEWQGGRRIRLSTHEEHFYTIARYEFTGVVQINTNEQCHVCMLVEGEQVEVIANGQREIFHYAETFVVPARVKTYELKQQGDKRAFVVIAHVKDEYSRN